MVKNQTGSIFIWILLAVLLIGVTAGGFWYFQKIKNLPTDLTDTQEVNQAVDQSNSQPSPSPDYSLVQQKYGLNQQQVDILSHVVKDDGSKL